MCLGRILDGKIIFYTTTLSSMHIALKRWAANLATTAHSLRTRWVFPHPMHFLWGSRDTYGHFGLWILDSPSDGHVQDTLMYGCWTIPAMGLAALPGLSCSSIGHWEAFPSDRTRMPSLEEYMSPNYHEHATTLHLFRASSLSIDQQRDFTTGCSWSRSWMLWLKAECLEVLENNLNLDLEILIWDYLHFLVFFLLHVTSIKIISLKQNKLLR